MGMKMMHDNAIAIIIAAALAAGGFVPCAF